MVSIQEYFHDLEDDSVKETLAVVTIMLLHMALPIITTWAVKEMGKDHPLLADFCTAMARVIMKLSSHTYFASGDMMHYNNLTCHLEIPFQWFSSNVCYEGRNFQDNIDIPKQVLLRNE